MSRRWISDRLAVPGLPHTCINGVLSAFSTNRVEYSDRHDKYMAATSYRYRSDGAVGGHIFEAFSQRTVKLKDRSSLWLEDAARG